MKRWIPILVASLLTVCLSVLISFFPANRIVSVKEASADYNNDPKGNTIQLTDRNLVDFLAPLSLHMQIFHVDLRQSILSIDFVIHPDHATKAQVYDDLYQVAQNVFERTENIDIVFIRVLGYPDSGPSDLYLALDARRTQWKDHEKMKNSTDSEVMKRVLLSRFHFVFTTHWNGWYGV